MRRALLLANFAGKRGENDFHWSIVSKPGRIVLVLAPWAIAAAGAGYETLPREPRYPGQRLDQWLELDAFDTGIKHSAAEALTT